MAKTCSVDGCSRSAIAKGLCNAHYLRMKNNGDVEAYRPINDRRGAFNRNWKGGQATMPDGRVLIHAPEHPHPGVSGKYVFRYRLLLEKHLGRFLTEDEIVHHKNGNVTDDRIENLEVMSQSDHAKHHDTLQTSNSELQTIRAKKLKPRKLNGQFQSKRAS